MTEPTSPETLINTPIEDLHITGKHTAIPAWLCQPAPPTLLALACLEFRPEPLPLVVWLRPLDSPRVD
jgi:hypothetical protein